MRLFNHETGHIEVLIKNMFWYEVINDKFIHIQETDNERFKIVFEVVKSNTLRKTSMNINLPHFKLNKYGTRYIVKNPEDHIISFW